MRTRRREFLIGCGGAALLGAAPLRKKTVSGVEIPIPHPEHPRLYLRRAHIGELPVRLKDPALKTVVERISRYAATLPHVKAEWDAVHYLISGDEAVGRRIISEAGEILRTAKLPDRGDPARVTGRMMVTGAIVYDWLYELFTPAERQEYIRELVRLAGTLECGYPPVKQGSITGHSSEAMIMRDLISAGIAIYDEFPEMYELAAARFFAEHVSARNWFYSGHAYHQGDSYSTYRYCWDAFALFIFDRLGAGNVFNPEQRYVPYHFLYTTRPDGQRLRAGDTYMITTPKGQPWREELGTVLTASYYRDGVLLGQHLRHPSDTRDNSIFEFLWRDIKVNPEERTHLPLTRYFASPFGWMVARTGWDENAAIIEMKINEYNFVNHQHLDAGAFQIYYRGPLAIDSGIYEGTNGAYNSPHCKNYYWRTIAHNSLLIYDPAEDIGVPDYGNDGGQRLPNRRREARNLEVLLNPQNGYRTGEVLGHGFGPDEKAPDYTFLQGDLTKAYSNKVTAVTRTFAAFNLKNERVPAALVVFDRVAGADPAFKKFWLLHSMQEPAIDGRSAVVDAPAGQAGRITLDVLLPGEAHVEAVGGPGKEFWVFGKNYPNDVRPATKDRGTAEPGAWRIEVSPRNDAREDLFLTVMQVTNRENGEHWPAKPLTTDDRTGCIIEGPEVCWAALFRRDGTRSAAPVQLSLASGSRSFRCLIAGLAPGSWSATRTGRDDVRKMEVPQSSGVAWFEVPAGDWILRRD
jgi:heparin/heparan-sulfate lyase